MPIPGLVAGRPLDLTAIEVGPEWIGPLGHMRAKTYVALFDDAVMAFFAQTGLTDGTLRHGRSSPFLTDLHAAYRRELKTGDRIGIAAQTLAVEAKRARLILIMRTEPDGALAATCELAIVNMGLGERRSEPWSMAQVRIWDELMAAHRGLSHPSQRTG